MQAVLHKAIPERKALWEKNIDEKDISSFVTEAEQTQARGCPCCGTAPSAFLEPLLSALAVRICCQNCKIQTSRYVIGCNAKGEYRSAVDALHEAVTVWNRRPER